MLGYVCKCMYMHVCLKTIAPFVCAHPRCAAWAHGREDGKDFNTGAYGAAGRGVCSRDYTSFNIKVIHIQ